MSWAHVLVGLITVVLLRFFALSLLTIKKKFIPATDYISAIEVARRLHNEGFTPIINLLGEHYTDRKKVERTFKQYIYLIDAFHGAGIKGKISVKPTQLGLAISKEIYCDFIWRLARRAHNQKIPLEIDMDGVKYLDDALEVFRKIIGEYNVRQRGISKNRFIIQTLYGVRNDLKNKWRNKGFRVEVYVPVGPWHKALSYIWRRVKEILKKR